MKSRIIAISIVFTLGCSACHTSDKTKMQIQKEHSIKKTENMHNLISIVEIPTADFQRAVHFYSTVLDITIKEVEMDGTKLGVLPNDEGTINVVLAKGNDYKPTADGAVLYLNAGSDLQPTLDKIAQNGGQVIVPKTSISPEMGFFALFIDTEGNKVGLHSTN